MRFTLSNCQYTKLNHGFHYQHFTSNTFNSILHYKFCDITCMARAVQFKNKMKTTN